MQCGANFRALRMQNLNILNHISHFLFCGWKTEKETLLICYLNLNYTFKLGPSLIDTELNSFRQQLV